MSPLVFCFLIIRSVPPMLCADYTSLSKEDENDAGEPLGGMQPAEQTGRSSMRRFINDVDLVQESSPRALYARGQFSRVWFGSDGIAPASFESMDRDDCVRPQDWVGFQEDPYDLDEFASSNLKRRSISDELASFDRCKQCDDFSKPEFGSESHAAKLKNTSKLKNHEHFDARRTSWKAKVLPSAYTNSSFPALDQKAVNNDLSEDSYEGLGSINHLLKLKALSKPETNKHFDAHRTNRKETSFLNSYLNSSIRIPVEKSELTGRTNHLLRDSADDSSPEIIAKPKIFRSRDKKSTREGEASLRSHLNNRIRNLVGKSLLSGKNDRFLGENVNTKQSLDSSNVGSIRLPPHKRSSEKNKKKKAKKERKKLEKAMKDLKRKEPLLSVLYEEAKKNEQAMKILAGAKRKPKSAPESTMDADKSFDEKSEPRPIAVRNLVYNPDLDKHKFVQELRYEKSQNSGVFKRGLAVVKNSQASSPLGSNFMFSEIFASPIVFTTDAEGEDDDEESVTVKVYESALRRGNNSLISDLRFVPNHNEVIESIYQHFRARNSSDESPNKIRLKANNVEALIDSTRNSGVFDGNSVFVAENDYSSSHLSGGDAGGEGIRTRKSNIEPMTVVNKLGTCFEANVAPKTAMADSVNDLASKASNNTDLVTAILNNSEESAVRNKTVGISTNVTAKEVSTEKVCNDSETSNSFGNLTSPTEVAVSNAFSNLTTSIEDKANNSVSGDISSLKISDSSVAPTARPLNETLSASKKVGADESGESSTPNKAETPSAVVETGSRTSDAPKQQVVASLEKEVVGRNHSTSVQGKEVETLENVVPSSRCHKTAADRIAPTVTKNLTVLSLEVFTKNPVSAAVTSSAISPANSSASVHSKNDSVAHEGNKLADKSNETEALLQENCPNDVAYEVSQECSDQNAPVQVALVPGAILESVEGLYPAAFDEDTGPSVAADPKYKHQITTKDQTSRPLEAADVDNYDPVILTNKIVELDYTAPNGDSKDTFPSTSQSKFDGLSDKTEKVDEISDLKPDTYPIVDEGKFSESENSSPDISSLDSEISPESLEAKYVGKRGLLSYIPSFNAASKPNSTPEFQSSNSKDNFSPAFKRSYLIPGPRQNSESANPRQKYEEISPVLSTKTNLGNIHSPSSYDPNFENTILGRSVPGNLRQERSESESKNNTEQIANLYVNELYGPKEKTDFLRTYRESDAKIDPVAVNLGLASDQGFAFNPNPNISFDNNQPNTPDFEPHRKVARRIKYAETDPYHGKHYDDTLRLINPFQNTPKRSSKELKNILAQSKCSANRPTKGSSINEMKQVKSPATLNGLNCSTVDPFGVEGPSALDMKIEGIISGKEPIHLVDKILAKVNGCGEMGRELGLGAPPSNCYEMEDLTMPVSRRESEVKLQAEKMMLLITKQLTQLIQDTSRKQGCYTLKPDLMNFLRWLLTPAPRTDQSCKDGKICRASKFR